MNLRKGKSVLEPTFSNRKRLHKLMILGTVSTLVEVIPLSSLFYVILHEFLYPILQLTSDPNKSKEPAVTVNLYETCFCVYFFFPLHILRAITHIVSFIAVIGSPATFYDM